MINRFVKYIEKEKLFSKDDTLVVAVSGGMDSMALLHLLLQGGYKSLLVAHCNYQLRGEASDLDEKLVVDFCKKHEVPFELKRFNMGNEMQAGHSLQMKARTLRYDWFEILLAQYESQHLLLAHHLLDNIETVLMNLFRGTGIRGVSGMKIIADCKVRPLLSFSKKDIKTYVEENHVPFRNDQSNLTNDYLRNSLRHKLLPVIKDLFPAFENNMAKSLENLRAVDQSYAFLLNGLSANMLSKDQDDSILIGKEALNESSSIENILHALLFEKGFSRTQILNIKDSLDSIGASFQTGNQELLIERTSLRLRTRTEVIGMNVPVNHLGTTDTLLGSLNVEEVDYEIAMKVINAGEKNKNVEFISLSGEQPSLRLRNWKEGDYIHPIGMHGRKKIQDLFTDLKLENALKAKVPILVNEAAEIIWVVEYRLDGRFKLDPLKACYKISWESKT